MNTSPSDGTLEVQGPLGTVTLKPEAVDGALKLTVLRVTGLGMTLPRERAAGLRTCSPTSSPRNLPMGIHADNVG